MFRGLLTEAVKIGYIGNDVAPDELAATCLCALTAASNQPSSWPPTGCTRTTSDVLVMPEQSSAS